MRSLRRGNENVVSDHVPTGFCCLKVSKSDGEIFPPYKYSAQTWCHIFTVMMMMKLPILPCA